MLYETELNRLIKRHKKTIRKDVINFFVPVAKEAAELYQEPNRAGTPKGEPIGLSKKKFHAALLMALHPNCLKLKEIAEIAEVSEGVLRVWRTEEQFRKVVEEQNTLLGESIANTMEYNFKRNQGIQIEQPKDKPFFDIIHDPEDPILAHISTFLANFFWLTLMLPFLNSLTSKVATDLLIKNLGEEFFFTQYAIIHTQYLNEGNPRENRNYERRPKKLEFTMFHIALLINLLLSPKTKQPKKDIARITKEYIFTVLKTLAA